MWGIGGLAVIPVNHMYFCLLLMIPHILCRDIDKSDIESRRIKGILRAYGLPAFVKHQYQISTVSGRSVFEQGLHFLRIAFGRIPYLCQTLCMGDCVVLIDGLPADKM